MCSRETEARYLDRANGFSQSRARVVDQVHVAVAAGDEQRVSNELCLGSLSLLALHHIARLTLGDSCLHTTAPCPRTRALERHALRLTSALSCSLLLCFLTSLLRRLRCEAPDRESPRKLNGKGTAQSFSKVVGAPQDLADNNQHAAPSLSRREAAQPLLHSPQEHNCG